MFMSYFLKNKKQNKGGFMMVELLVIAAVLVMLIISASAVAQKGIEVSRRSLHQMQASLILEEGAEIVRILRDNNWTNISGPTALSYYYASFSNGTWSVSQTPSAIGIFTRRIVFSDVYRDASTQDIVSSGGVLDTGTKLVTVSVGWTEGTTVMEKNIKFYITDLF